MSWGLVVAVLILSYLLVESLREKMSQLLVRCIELMVTLSILCYVPVFVVFAMHDQSIIPWVYGITFTLGLVGTMIIPALTACVLTVVWSYYVIKDMFTGRS